MSDKHALRFSAGLLLRGHVRRELALNGFNYQEHKALGASVFVVPDLSRAQYARLYKWVREMAS